MLLSAQSIRREVKRCHMIVPFSERTVRHGKTFGLSAAGYDVTIKRDIWLWPFWGRLAVTEQKFNIPTDLVMRVHDKSSWARCFVLVQNTVGEPGWRGYLTLELTRFLPWPIRIKAGSPIAQVMFEMLDEPTDLPYDGKYQDQGDEPTPAIYETTTDARRA